MDQETKKQIKKMVLFLRNLLENDLAIVMKRYGIFTDRAWMEVEAIPKLTDDLHVTRERLEAAMGPDLGRGVTKPKAAELYIREAGFTHLNRLAGLKVLEVRELIPEVIQNRSEYAGRSLYQRDYRDAHPEEAQRADDALPAALEAMCRKVSRQIKFVFDMKSESSILWPRYAALKEAIDKINALPEAVWREDEIIGWIYQFYNAEEKEAIRKRGKPKLPIEVAVINQFFTPRWVVKFLVDNTLGRLWLEMHPDSERVRTKCDYLVPEPLSKGDEDDQEDKIELDPDSPINNPEAESRRDAKLPQDLKLIDPACGTMHFGHYAFEVFQEIYRDASERGWVEQEDALEDLDIPLAILKRNLYGVDIDLRAVQLAALSLYVKARTAQREAGMADKEVAKLPWQVNLVSADARLTDGDVREAFLKKYQDDPKLQKVWEELFTEMEDIAQVGSLLRVEERFKQLLKAYKPPSVEGLTKEEQESLPGMEAPVRQMQLGEADRTGTWSPRRTLQQMLADLKDFAREALDEQDVNAQIFAVEAEKALGLLDVLMQRYEVVVMNPPYGWPTENGKKYLIDIYPQTKNDLYAAFIERASELAASIGYVGCLASRTFLYLSRYENLRSQILMRDSIPVVMLDFGFGVLDDAMVETNAFILRNMESEARDEFPTIFIRLSDENDRVKDFEDVIHVEMKDERAYCEFLQEFNNIPRSPFAYWAPNSMRRHFADLPSLEPAYAIVRAGLSTGDDKRFVRYRWEVSHEDLGLRWRRFSKGGDYSKCYYDFDLVLDFSPNAVDVMSKQGNKLANRQHYGKEGLTYPRVTVKGFNVRRYPKNSVFSDKGCCIFPNKSDDFWFLLAFLNSTLVQAYLLMLTPSRSFEVSHVGALPVANMKGKLREEIARFARTSYQLKAAWDSGNEISSSFDRPWILLSFMGTFVLAEDTLCFDNKSFEIPESLQRRSVSSTNTSASIAEVLAKLEAIEHEANSILKYNQALLDELVYSAYSIKLSDRLIITRELGQRPTEIVWPQMESKSRREKQKEHVHRLISYLILESLTEDQDGVISFVDVGEPTVLDHIRSKIESEFGEDRALDIETEAGQILGKSVADWIDGPFIKWHTQLYKKRPIIWHISSPKRTFGCLVYYHKMSCDTLVSVRTVYLWRLRDQIKAELETALAKEDHKRASVLETALEDIGELDQALEEILASGWDVDIDAGVKPNILPLQEAGVLRYKKLV